MFLASPNFVVAKCSEISAITLVGIILYKKNDLYTAVSKKLFLPLNLSNSYALVEHPLSSFIRTCAWQRSWTKTSYSIKKIDKCQQYAGYLLVQCYYEIMDKTKKMRWKL